MPDQIVAQDWIAVRKGDTEETLAARVLEVEHRIYPQRAAGARRRPRRARRACAGLESDGA